MLRRAEYTSSAGGAGDGESEFVEEAAGDLLVTAGVVAASSGSGLPLRRRERPRPRVLGVASSEEDLPAAGVLLLLLLPLLLLELLWLLLSFWSDLDRDFSFSFSRSLSLVFGVTVRAVAEPAVEGAAAAFAVEAPRDVCDPDEDDVEAAEDLEGLDLEEEEEPMEGSFLDLSFFSSPSLSLSLSILCNADALLFLPRLCLPEEVVASLCSVLVSATTAVVDRSFSSSVFHAPISFPFFIPGSSLGLRLIA